MKLSRTDVSPWAFEQAVSGRLATLARLPTLMMGNDGLWARRRVWFIPRVPLHHLSRNRDPLSCSTSARENKPIYFQVLCVYAESFWIFEREHSIVASINFLFFNNNNCHWKIYRVWDRLERRWSRLVEEFKLQIVVSNICFESEIVIVYLNIFGTERFHSPRFGE